MRYGVNSASRAPGWPVPRRPVVPRPPGRTGRRGTGRGGDAPPRVQLARTEAGVKSGWPVVPPNVHASTSPAFGTSLIAPSGL